MHQEIFLGLKKIPFFSKLPDETLHTLAGKAKSFIFPKQAIIISEGDDSSSLYIILSGKVRVFSSDEKNREVTLLVQECGSYFGELALIGNEPRSAYGRGAGKNSMRNYLKEAILNTGCPVTRM